jgi:hypothetical protein
MKPLKAKNLGVTVNPKKGTLMRHQDRYQLAPAATKNAPERNLKSSFQLIFITLGGFLFGLENSTCNPIDWRVTHPVWGIWFARWEDITAESK